MEAESYFANLTAIAVSWIYLTLFSTLFYANHIYCKPLITLLLKMATCIYLAFYFRISRLSLALLIRSNLEDYSHRFQDYLIAAAQKLRNQECTYTISLEELLFLRMLDLLLGEERFPVFLYILVRSPLNNIGIPLQTVHKWLSKFCFSGLPPWKGSGWPLNITASSSGSYYLERFSFLVFPGISLAGTVTFLIKLKLHLFTHTPLFLLAQQKSQYF